MTSHCFGLILNELNLFALQLMETDLFFCLLMFLTVDLKRKEIYESKQTNLMNQRRKKNSLNQNKVTTTSAATTKINWKKNNMKIIENKEE